MPKKKNPETPEEQAERFRREAQKLVDAGELTLTEGESAMDAFVRSSAREEKPPANIKDKKPGKTDFPP
jgi:hypothetical protein